MAADPVEANQTQRGSMTQAAQHHPYRDFEHAGWQRAASAYADTFGTISSFVYSKTLKGEYFAKGLTDRFFVVYY